MAIKKDAQKSPELGQFYTKNEIKNKEYVKEYIQFLSLALIFCLLVAIITFDPTDSSSFNINSSKGNLNYHNTNTFGPLGATISDWLFQLFGMGSIVFLFVFFIQIIATFKIPKEKGRFYLKLFGYPQLILCYLCLASAISETTQFRGIDIYTGGIIGYNTLHFFQNFLGKNGALIAFLIGFVSSFTLALGIRPIASIIWLTSLIPFKKAKEFAETIKDISTQTKNENEISNSHQSITENKNFFQNAIPAEIKNDASQIIIDSKISFDQYVKPTNFGSLLSLLDYHKNESSKKNIENENKKLQQEALLIEEKLLTFGVSGKVIKSLAGPVIHIHEFEPASGVKVNKVFVLQDDLALALKAHSLRIYLQPGKSTLGIEVPGFIREVISLRELLESPQFVNKDDSLPVVLGKNTDGSPLITDLCQMPHLLVAGATGSGKSVCINTMLLSLLISKTPRQLRLILIDPKMLELSNYNGIGHLLMPVVTEPEKAAGALKWAIQEMERRYELMKNVHVRNISAYNESVQENNINNSDKKSEFLPFIVVIVDELCDLMMTAPKDVEESIQRLAQKARAAGIHLILATQRPSVDVLTGVIKANLPCRLSFQVASRHDSRTIIESIGAEKLLGKGDMLFLPPGLSKVTRAQCAFVNDKEINSVSDKLRLLYPAYYENDIMKDIERVSSDLKQKNDKNNNSNYSVSSSENNNLDENLLFEKCVEFAFDIGSVSTSSIQREFRIGYNRAARIMDKLVKEGLVGQSESAGKPRPVIKVKG